MLIFDVRKVLLISAQKKKTGCKDIERQVAAFSGPEKAGYAFPGINFYRYFLNPSLKKKGIAPHKKFVLKGLPGVCYLRTCMFDKIFHFGGENHLNSQYPSKNLSHGIPETGSYLMCVDQQHIR